MIVMLEVQESHLFYGLLVVDRINDTNHVGLRVRMAQTQ